MTENPLALINPISALVAGFLTSLHCMGMCGPLACVLLGGNQKSRTVTVGGYHIGKLASYTALGAIAGGLGARFVSSINAPPVFLLTGSMALFFFAMALGLDRHLIKFPLVNRLSWNLTRRALQIRPGYRGVALGALTPFIPCGPLYLIIWVSSLAGSASGGATMLALFGLGTIPGLLTTQLGWSTLTTRVNPIRLSQWRRILTFAASITLAIRSFADINIEALISTGGFCH